MLRNVSVNPASFRDPSGFVFEEDGEIRRAVTRAGIGNLKATRATGLIDRLIKDGRLLPEEEIGTELAGHPEVCLVLRHPRLPFVSYPYEWSFSALQAAALLHLDIQIEALEAGVVLSDASAYNVQFLGSRPVFIDHLSFRLYRDRELWAAHHQFCEQFLNPLLLQSLMGIDFQSWYRGRAEGIPGEQVRRMLKVHHLLDWRVVGHVVLPAHMQRRMQNRAANAQPPAGKLSRRAFFELLRSLRKWISQMRVSGLKSTTWSDYDTVVPPAESDAIASFVEVFVRATTPHMLWDIGCNAGRYGQVALSAGARCVVGLDNDPGVIDQAFARARHHDLDLLPLLNDIADPSPSQGWRAAEHSGLLDRGRPSALLAIAVMHHVVAGRNAPLDQMVTLLTDLASDGVVGFVPKTDARARSLFAGRDEVFREYTVRNFLALLGARARIVQQQVIPDTDRMLVWFSRR